MKCDQCLSKEINNKIHTTRSSPNFSGDKIEPGANPNFFFCNDNCKKKFIQEARIQSINNTPYLAELDQSMNYCEFFHRLSGNEGVYKRDGFEYKVNGLWDYKSYDSNIIEANKFKESYKKYFGNFNRFQLHNRYIIK